MVHFPDYAMRSPFFFFVCYFAIIFSVTSHKNRTSNLAAKLRRPAFMRSGVREKTDRTRIPSKEARFIFVAKELTQRLNVW